MRKGGEMLDLSFGYIILYAGIRSKLMVNLFREQRFHFRLILCYAISIPPYEEKKKKFIF